MCCKKCGAMFGLLILAVGVLFLLRDLNIWNFWNIQWYTVVFIFAGLGGICIHGCPECQKGCCEVPNQGKKLGKRPRKGKKR